MQKKHKSSLKIYNEFPLLETRELLKITTFNQLLKFFPKYIPMPPYKHPFFANNENFSSLFVLSLIFNVTNYFLRRSFNEKFHLTFLMNRVFIVLLSKCHHSIGLCVWGVEAEEFKCAGSSCCWIFLLFSLPS